jgi:GWxTD domain-containing protein
MSMPGAMDFRGRLLLRSSCALAVLLILSVAGADPILTDEPTRDWRAGPIHYILNVEQDHQFKALGTPEERGEFIERFWKGLDPAPETEVNERREEFWKRVNEANRLFRESLTPGWKTDRGKVYILIGPPDERIQQGNGELWKYQAVGRVEATPGVQIRFRKLSRGEFEMGRDALQYRNPLAESDGRPAGATFLAVPSENGEPGIARERIRMADFPRGEARTEYFSSLLPFHHRYDFYKAADGVTRVLLTLSVPSHPAAQTPSENRRPDMQLSTTAWDTRTGKIVAQDSHLMRRDDARSKDGEVSLFFQREFALDPGTYQIDMTFFEPESHLGNRHSTTMTVPDFRKDFAVSSIAVGHLATGPAGPLAPVQGGSIALVAEPVPVFAPGETMAFAYQVYNARRQGKEPDLNVEYRFMMEAEGGLQPVARPVAVEHLKSETLAYSLPLQGWPEAAYRIEIRLTDNLAGLTVAGDGSFVVRSSGRKVP